MTDISHIAGQDLEINNQGGLETTSGATEGQQRVLRRLLTNAGSYLWHLPYGAGLPSYLGTPVVIQSLQAVIIAQMKLEKAVVQSPPPVVTVGYDTSNTVIANISYIDASSNLTSALTIPVIS